MRRPGFAIMYAIAALALLGALVSLVGVGIRGRMRDLDTVQVDAQLRQLIVAGAQLSRAGVTGDAALPGELGEDASLRIITDDAEPRVAASFRRSQSECPIPQ